MTKEALRKAIGAKIRDERLARNLSAEELAKLLSLSPGFIGLIESGRRGATVYNLHRLANVFDMPVSAFFPDEIEKRSVKNELPPVNARRAKLSSIISDLDELEIDYIINIVKEIKQILFYNSKKTKNPV